jgi:hypothetical protein
MPAEVVPGAGSMPRRARHLIPTQLPRRAGLDAGDRAEGGGRRVCRRTRSRFLAPPADLAGRKVGRAGGGVLGCGGGRMALTAARAYEVHGGRAHEITARTGRRNRDAVLTPDRPQPGRPGPGHRCLVADLEPATMCVCRAQDNGSASNRARAGSPRCRSAIPVGTLARVARDVMGPRTR